MWKAKQVWQYLSIGCYINIFQTFQEICLAFLVGVITYHQADKDSVTEATLPPRVLRQNAFPGTPGPDGCSAAGIVPANQGTSSWPRLVENSIVHPPRSFQAVESKAISTILDLYLDYRFPSFLFAQLEDTSKMSRSFKLILTSRLQSICSDYPLFRIETLQLCSSTMFFLFKALQFLTYFPMTLTVA